MVKFCDIYTMAFTFQSSNNDDLETKMCINIMKWQTRPCSVDRYVPRCLQGLSLDLSALFFFLFLCSVLFFYDSIYCFCNKKKHRPDVCLVCSCKPGWPPWSLCLFCVLTVLTHHMLIFLLPLLESVIFFPVVQVPENSCPLTFLKEQWPKFHPHLFRSSCPTDAIF